MNIVLESCLDSLECSSDCDWGRDSDWGRGSDSAVTNGANS